jgi:hypothetical protein
MRDHFSVGNVIKVHENIGYSEYLSQQHQLDCFWISN